MEINESLKHLKSSEIDEFFYDNKKWKKIGTNSKKCKGKNKKVFLFRVKHGEGTRVVKICAIPVEINKNDDLLNMISKGNDKILSMINKIEDDFESEEEFKNQDESSSEKDLENVDPEHLLNSISQGKEKVLSMLNKIEKDFESEEEFYKKNQALNPNITSWTKTENKDLPLSEIKKEEIISYDIPDPIELITEKAAIIKREKQLEKLNRDVSLKQYISIDDPKKYDIVKKFISERGLKIYGGTAINYYLPPEKQFYKSHESPDYDIFSPDPWNDAVDLAELFYQTGYNFIEVKAGLHKGTYKVFVYFWPVADFSFMEQNYFDILETKKIDNMNIVSPFKLIESFYKEYATPLDNPKRWVKIYKREKLLLDWVKPLEKQFNCSKDIFTDTKEQINDDPLLVKLLEIISRFINRYNLLISGSIAYNSYIEIGEGTKRLKSTCLSALSDRPKEIITELLDNLISVYPKLQLNTNYIASKEINNTIYTILYENENGNLRPIFKLFNLTVCTPFILYKNRKIVSIDYLKYELYENSVFSPTEQEREDEKCKLKYLEEIQNNYYKKGGFTEFSETPFQRFVLNCEGEIEEKHRVILLNRWLEREKEKKKVVREWTPKYKIRKIPYDKTPLECKNLDKDLCKYPCAWNRYIKKCSSIPKGVYRPSDRQYLKDYPEALSEEENFSDEEID